MPLPPHADRLIRSQPAKLRAILEKGDLRSIGQVMKVISLISKDAKQLGNLIELTVDDDPRVCARAADALEKLTNNHPEWLQNHKKPLLDLMGKSPQKEVQWHWCQILTRLTLKKEERTKAVKRLQNLLDSESKIVRTFALQSICDVTLEDKRFDDIARKALDQALHDDSAAMKARARKLYKRWELAHGK